MFLTCKEAPHVGAYVLIFPFGWNPVYDNSKNYANITTNLKAVV